MLACGDVFSCASVVRYSGIIGNGRYFAPHPKLYKRVRYYAFLTKMKKNIKSMLNIIDKVFGISMKFVIILATLLCIASPAL